MALFWYSLPWMAGITAAEFAPLTLWQWGLLLFLSLLGIPIALRRTTRQAFILCSLFFLGGLRFQASQPDFPGDHVIWINDAPGTVTLYGIICDDPDVRDTYTGLRLCVERMRVSGDSLSHAARGTVLLYAGREGQWEYGDRIRAWGHLTTPPEFETFSYRDYLARQGIHSMMTDASVKTLAEGEGNSILHMLFSLRSHAHAVIHKTMPAPEAPLLAGILLGLEHGIAPDVQEAFNITGTTHIIAISGFNITILAGFVIALFGRWLGRRPGMAAAGLVILLYTVLVGADAAVVRAAIMGGITLLARALGRQTFAFASLGASALLMSLINPSILFDVGFQLSFAATLGLILYADKLQAGFLRAAEGWMSPEQAQRLAGPVGEYILMTVAAQATTLPLTVLYFGRFSLISFLVNPLILPVQPAIMMGGGAAVFAGLLWPPAGRVAALPVWLLLAYTIRVVEAAATLPLASIPAAQAATAWCLGYYLLLFGLTAYVSLPEERRPLWTVLSNLHRRLALPSVVAILALVAGLTWRAVSAAPDGKLHITFFPAGNGDMILLDTPDGRHILIDGGESPVYLADVLGRRFPPWNRNLDLLILAGTRTHQLAGLLDITARFNINLALSPVDVSGSVPQAILEELHAQSIPVVELEPGQLFHQGVLTVEALSAGPYGTNLLITHDRFRALLLPGADPASIPLLSVDPRLEDVTVILLADGGGEACNSPALLAHTRPLVTLLSVEAGRSRARPSSAVLAALSGSTVLRTDELGWIEIQTDGQTLWIHAEREASSP